MRGKRTSDEVRAAVTAALLAGQGVNDVARQYQLDPSLVSRIKATISPQVLQQVAIAKDESLDTLITDLLRANLIALRNIAEVAGSADYARKQAGNDLAVLFGVITDKTVRLLEAAAAAGAEAD